MKDALDKVCSMVNRIYGGAALLLLAVLTGAMAVQVFTRYVLGSSLSGTEELGRYCFIWMTMLGASICVSSDSHAAVTILNDHLKGRMNGGHKISWPERARVTCLRWPVRYSCLYRGLKWRP